MSTIAKIIDLNKSQCDGRAFFTMYANGLYRSYSYSDVWQRAKAFQARFETMGIKSGSTIAILLPQGLDLIASFWGGILGGFIPTVLPPRTHKQDIDTFWNAHIPLFERLNLKVVISSPAVCEELKKRTSISDIDTISPETVHFLHPPETTITNSESAVFLQHSSGTTGTKKGVILTNNQVIKQVQSYSKFIRLDPQVDHIASWLPLYHDMGLIACLILPTLTGTPVTMLDPFEWVMRPTILLDVIKHQKSTLAWLPNFAFLHIANNLKSKSITDLASIRMIVNCSEPAKREAFDCFKKALTSVDESKLHTCYALAENTFAVSQTTNGISSIVIDQKEYQSGRIVITDSGSEIMSCGQPIEGVKIEIVDENKSPLSDGKIGEVSIRSPFVANGYWKLPEATEKNFIGDLYYTGDLGFLYKGDLYITGRKDDLIIVKGKNLYAHNIEEIISRIDGVTPGRVVVLGYYDDFIGSSELLVIIEPTSEGYITSAEQRDTLRLKIRNAIFDHVGIYPKKIHIVPNGWLLKSTSGKISRSRNLNKITKENEAK